MWVSVLYTWDSMDAFGKILTLSMEHVIFTPAAWALCCAAVLAGGVLLLVVAPPPRCVSGSCARAALVVPGPLASSGALPGLALERAAASAARRPRPARCPRGHACPRSVGLSPPAPGPWAPWLRPAPTKKCQPVTLQNFRKWEM